MIPSRRVQKPDKMSQGLLPRKELVERKGPKEARNPY